MKYTIRDRCIALAGVFQACALVQQIASRGTANSAVIETSIESLFRFDASSTEDVFGGLAGVSTGVRTLKQQLTNARNERDMDITRYVISLLVLERNLNRNPAMLDTVTSRLKDIETSLDYFHLGHDTIYAKLGSLYQDTISTLGPRVMVSGEQPHLSNETNASKVRALLLAGIRSAVLWRQCGGSRWQILFSRKKYVQECDSLLAAI
ncbi:MAG: high frequency lysogenization protein HflD [Gammaproteobacteria bacterium]